MISGGRYVRPITKDNVNGQQTLKLNSAAPVKIIFIALTSILNLDLNDETRKPRVTKALVAQKVGALAFIITGFG